MDGGSNPPSSTNTLKANPTGWLFFACYRVFARVPAGSCGLRREPFLPVTGAFYSPFAYSLSDPPHPLHAELACNEFMAGHELRLNRAQLVVLRVIHRHAGVDRAALGFRWC